MDAPERWWLSNTEYLRAALVDRLIAEAVAKERERCAEIVRREQSDMTRKHYDRFSSALAAIREGGE